MIYLDYSATTPVNEEVLDSFIKVSRDYIGNANSLHKLGLDSKKLMQKSCEQVASLLKVKPTEVIFTSSASEANNMVLKGVLEKYKNRGCHIITTKLEHSSILETVSYLESVGYEVDFVPVKKNGQVDFDALQNLIRKDTVLISIHQVNSEVGIVQDVNKIGAFLKENYPKVFFHVDGTQSVGKIPVCLDNIDLFTCSAHKFYGLKGIACLIKKENVGIIPLIHGGKSQTDFRSGTPSVALMVSFAKALRLALENLDKNIEQVKKLNLKLRKLLFELDGIVVNTPEESIPHILNISVLGIKPEVMLHALEQDEIYISTKTACSKDNQDSLSLTAMGFSRDITSSSIRISISHLTSDEEIVTFFEIFKKQVKNLKLK